MLHLDNTNIINFVRKNISSGVWFTYFYQNYPLAAKSLTITKFYSLRWLSPLVLPVLFILKIGLVAILSLSDKYSFLYSKLIYRLLYSVSFIYGFYSKIINLFFVFGLFRNDTQIKLDISSIILLNKNECNIFSRFI